MYEIETRKYGCFKCRCPVDEKLIAKFQGSWAQGPAMYETVLYAHMKTFRQDAAIIVLQYI